MGTAIHRLHDLVIALWFGWNTLAPASLRFDPYTFTFLTLMLSLQASYAAPLILLAQNRQADRDRVALEEDRRRATQQKADTEYLAREIAALRIAMGEVATRDFLRSELARLAEELDEAGAAASGTGGGKPERPAGAERVAAGRMALATGHSEATASQPEGRRVAGRAPATSPGPGRPPRLTGGAPGRRARRTRPTAGR